MGFLLGGGEEQKRLSWSTYMVMGESGFEAMYSDRGIGEHYYCPFLCFFGGEGGQRGEAEVAEVGQFT